VQSRAHGFTRSAIASITSGAIWVRRRFSDAFSAAQEVVLAVQPQVSERRTMRR
jgi:hypothetical protein